MVDATLHYDKESLEQLCHKRHVKRLDLFGSVAKGEAETASDVDLLVEYEPGCVPGLLDFLAFERELASVFEGRKIDLVSRGGLSPYLRDEILQTRRLLYEQ